MERERERDNSVGGPVRDDRNVWAVNFFGTSHPAKLLCFFIYSDGTLLIKPSPTVGQCATQQPQNRECAKWDGGLSSAAFSTPGTYTHTHIHDIRHIHTHAKKLFFFA